MNILASPPAPPNKNLCPQPPRLLREAAQLALALADQGERDLSLDASAADHLLLLEARGEIEIIAFRPDRLIVRLRRKEAGDAR